MPVGRRLAFDAQRGRLWIVCRRCAGWNLTPFESRWEALEECERLFRSTRLRASTDQIGMAQLRSDLELIRIGRPLRPELAVWRYSPRLTARWVRSTSGRTVAAVAGLAAYGTAMVGVGVMGPVLNLCMPSALRFATDVLGRRVVLRVTTGGRDLTVRKADLGLIHWAPGPEDGTWSISLPLLPADRGRTRSAWGAQWPLGLRFVELRGADAERVAALLLPRINRSGGTPRQVRRAVEYLDEVDDPFRSVQAWAKARGPLHEEWLGLHHPDRRFRRHRGAISAGLTELPTFQRLAMEMAAHDEFERRAMEGELALLEDAWREAEEIAAIADHLP